MTRDRILSKVEMHESGCWLWMGATRDNGYGAIGWRVEGRSRTFQAHRVAYQLWRGDIPEGQHVDHDCGVRHCVNPWHLTLRTQAEHNARHQTKTHCIHGHFKHGLRWCRECARLRELRKRRAVA